MRRIAFIFPGQGSQKKGMGKDLYDSYDRVQEIYEEADSILGYSLSTLSFEGPEEKLKKTAYTQPAVLVNSWAIACLLMDLGITATHTAGHSLGEYTALLQAGVLDFSSAVQLVRRRGELMEEAYAAGKGTMAAILGLDRGEVSSLCESAREYGVVVSANYNAPGQIVISGEREAVERASLLAKERGAKRVIPLKVSGPFHSPLMEHASNLLEAELDLLTLNTPSLKVVSNVSAQFLMDEKDVRTSLIEQLRSPVLWDESMRLMIEDGVNTFIEVGPGKVLKGLLRYIDRGVTTFHVEDNASLEKTRKALSL